jgi:ubiquinone/menaquinone biosynthesis C-methylase UbiE
MTVLTKLARYGVSGSAQKIIDILKLKTGWYDWKYRNYPQYHDPTSSELVQIESCLRSLNIAVESYLPDPQEFQSFLAQNYFPDNYCFGKLGGVWHEKMLEHWISSTRLNIADYSPEDIYVDVAAASSPWARILRERQGVNAYAIDLDCVGATYKNLSYYRVENATQTSFSNASVKGISLHCAYEMFMADDDVNLIAEIARILTPSGKAVILPLYMHTHYCAYSSPKYFGQGFSDPQSKEYVRINANSIPSSRKYDAAMLKTRILDKVINLGMSYQLFALRNQQELGNDIYCHFILEINR